MVFCILIAVFAVSVYLLISHLSVVHFTISGDCWLLLFLTLGSGCGLAAFLFWFTKNTRRIMKSRRDQLRDIRGLTFESPVQISVIPTTTSQDSQWSHATPCILGVVLLVANPFGSARTGLAEHRPLNPRRIVRLLYVNWLTAIARKRFSRNKSKLI